MIFSSFKYCSIALVAAIAVLTLLNFVAVNSAIAAKFQAQVPSDNPAYDFEADIFAVMKAKCFQCHAGKIRKGDLRLDSKSEIEKGGHTGSEILGTVDESELLRRIVSTKNGYRMPKKGERLSEPQIAKFRNWIADGSPWPNAAPANKTAADDRSAISKNKDATATANSDAKDRLADTWIAFSKLYQQRKWRYLLWFVLPISTIAFFVWLNGALWRRRQRRKGASFSYSIFDHFGKKAIGALLVSLAAIVAFLFGSLEDKDDEIASLKKYGTPVTNIGTNNSESDSPPRVSRPMHPPRLGGDYYRGNDERDRALFNGGFYRTANLNVHLVDQDGNELNYQSDCSDLKLAIRFRMERAKGATRELFTERLLGSTFASKSFRGTEAATDKVMLQSDGDEDHWSFVYPIELSATGTASGNLYLYYGSLERNRIHYMIRYDLKRLPNGRLDPSSEVWMGSAYDLAGRVIEPEGDQIALDHWFDFRPIPEIEGQNAESPALLGLPEHLGDEK